MSRVKLLLIIGFAIAAFYSGVYVCDLEWKEKHSALLLTLDAALHINMQSVLQIERLQRDKSNAIAEKLAAERAAQAAKARVITKEVVKYVETNANAGAVVDDDFVCIYNNSVPSVRVPGTAEATSGTNATAGGNENITTGDVLSITVENYAVCRDAIARLQAWQNWYKSVSQ